LISVDYTRYSYIYIVFLQNDLIHGWGIDYKFGYCAQV